MTSSLQRVPVPGIAAIIDALSTWGKPDINRLINPA
jgi:hypothetical protein